MNEQERAAHLGRAWDTFRRIDLERCDPDDVAAVRSLIALDRLPLPDPRFVARLEGALAGTGATPPLHWPSTQIAGPVADHREAWPLPELPEWRRHPALARWAAAGITVLICGALVLLAFQAGSGDDDTPTSLPAYGDASTVALPWQETPECDVPARSGDSFRTLIALSASYSQPVPPPLDEVGLPADLATTAQVEATMREILACRTERETGREYALYSNEALLRANQLAEETQGLQLLEGLLRSAELVANLVGTPEPAPNDEEWLLVSVKDIRVLADGRVKASVLYRIGNAQGTDDEATSFVAFFVERGGIYLIDDAEGFTYLDSATPVVASGPVSGSAAAGMNTGEVTGATNGTVETRPDRVHVTNGDDGTSGNVIGEDEIGVTSTGDNDLTGQNPPVAPGSENNGSTSASVAVGGAAGVTVGGAAVRSMPSRSTPGPDETENPNPGNTSGGSAVGGISVSGTGDNVPSQPTPSPADQ